ncbi:MAG: hypothetical protein MZV63_25550 [Marinilabiliales bacterium]|nr:hypothetical protein [Marinilabiliales bacterium]
MPLVDGMCGSGTIPSEAGLMACNVAPGRFRKSFGFMTWKDYDAALLRSVRFEAEKRGEEIACKDLRIRYLR